LKAPLLILGIVLVACSRSTDSKATFTEEFVAALRSSDPALKVEMVGELEVRVSNANGKPYTIFLANAYAQARTDPSVRADIIKDHVASALESSKKDPLPFDRSVVIPVVKDRAWMSEIIAFQKSRGTEDPIEFVYDDYNDELVCVYAMDMPSTIRYVTPKDLQASGTSKTELASIARANLRRILPPVELHSGPLVSMVTCGGNYEASLLLLDEVWTGDTVMVEGDLLVAIPSRDVLLVAGSKVAGAPEKLRAMAEKIVGEGGHSLTSEVFVRRDGRFVRWKPE
jgi:uncharacterized protein YtpQ (UPF0354 family)